jgi:hypothetical protein
MPIVRIWPSKVFVHSSQIRMELDLVPSIPVVCTTDLLEDAIEKAYWNFDARKKGYSKWRNLPQSERDAFKAEVRQVLNKGCW